MTSFQWLSSSLAIEAIGNHLWQSTAFAALVGLATLAFRNNRAAVRHALWMVASVKFVVPFAALIAAGQLVGVRAPAPRVHRQITIVLETVGQRFTPFDIPPAARSFTDASEGPGKALPSMALAIWITGSIVVVAAWWIRWRRVATIARRATAIQDGRELDPLRSIERKAGATRPIALVASDASLEPGIFGIVHPVLIWPQRLATHLDDHQILTILAHEVAHVRRHDNLAAALHMIVEAVFWFHPLVWWIGVRLIDERERACDEDVLGLGHEPEVYAETILKSCRACIESPLPCVAGVTGSDLKKRIERIMKHDPKPRVTAWKRMLLVTLAVGPVATPILVGAATPRYFDVETTAARRSMSPQQTVAGPVQFEVASIKANRSASAKVAIHTQPGRFVATNVTLQQLIRNAYQLHDFQITGGPGWLASDRFDVVAKAEGADKGDLLSAEKPGAPSRLQLMLRALLTERFKLEAHAEAKELPLYALRLARTDGSLGPQLKRSARDCDAPDTNTRVTTTLPAGAPPCGMGIMPGTILAGGTPLTQLARTLSALLGRVVVDRTGLADNFELTLRWTPEDIAQGFEKKASALGLAPIDPDGPSLFTALREQLGLTLDSEKGPVDILIVDRVERPTEN